MIMPVIKQVNYIRYGREFVYVYIFHQEFTSDIFHLWVDCVSLPQATVVAFGKRCAAKTRPLADRCPLWGILEGLRDWDLCSFFMAVTRFEESLTECNEPLEFIDAIESEDDQQLIPILADDTPETQREHFYCFVCLSISERNTQMAISQKLTKMWAIRFFFCF